MFNTLTRMGASAAGDYEIERSLRFNAADNPYLTKTFSSAGNRRTFTFSSWIKINVSGNTNAFFSGSKSSDFFKFMFRDDGRIEVNTAEGGSDSSQVRTTRTFKDPTAWYHVVIAYDTTQATSSNRVKIYINGTQETDFDTNTLPSQNHDTAVNLDGEHQVGNQIGTSNYFDGYITEVNFVDGQQLTPSSFGKTNLLTGQWIPKKYVGSYGTNGFFLKFADNSNTTAATLGKDSSGNGHNFTPNNFSVSSGNDNDSVIDTPTNNFCTMNPLTTQNLTVSNGNLTVAPSGNNASGFSTMQIPASGKWYFELTKNSGDPMIGYSHQPSLPRNWQYDNETDGLGTYFYGNRIECYHGGSTVLDVTDAPWNDDANGTVFGILWDRDNNTLKHRYNNGNEVSFTIPSALQSLPLAFGYSVTTTWPAGNFTYNFGAGGFAYTIPTGYKTLSSANLSEPTIKDGTKYFNTVLYTGNGGSSQTITGLDFSPDFVWFKERSGTQNHMVFDTVRGVEQSLWPNGSWVEEAYSGEGVSAFNSNGVTIGNSGNLNVNSDSYVMWAWKESASAGFDIVTYTGTGSATTHGHSLGVKPDVILVKNRDQADGWQMYHSSMGATYNTQFNGAGIFEDDDGPWNDTEPTSSVFSVKDDHKTNASGEDYIAYLFASVENYSRCGSYIGNGSADGPFVYCGFRPAYILVKRVETTPNNYWNIFDTARDTYNSEKTANFKRLLAHTNSAEATNHVNYTPPDILSNGFKLRHGRADTNYNGKKFVFLAFAESPFKYANAR